MGALVGVQLFVVMVSVSGMLPVFLMYTVCVAVPPGFRDPTLRDVTVWVQPLSEYTPKLIAFIVPFRGTVWLVLSRAAVVRVSASAVIVRAITDSAGVFLICIYWFSNGISCVLSINKH